MILVEQVQASYREIDQETAALQAATGLQCPAGCGQCCENPEIETTVLEMLPIAAELWHQGEAEKWLQQVAELKQTDTCVFYQRDPNVPGNGRCSVYPWRPSICRLFGFATVTNKRGLPQLAACACHKKIVPEIVEKVQEAIAQGLSAPNFAEIATQITHLDPSLGQQQWPINQAFKLALEQIGLRLSWEYDSASSHQQ